MTYPIQDIRKDFPMLHKTVYGKPYTYLDNSATTQKPQVVIDRIVDLYQNENSNIHRGVHYFSERTTAAYEQTRKSVQAFINAKYAHEVIFTKGTTDSINLVAFSFCERYVREGDEIIVSEMEHHSNIVPWQLACDRKKAVLKVIPFDENGELILSELKKLLTEKTRILALTHVSNTLGTVNPISEVIQTAHAAGVPVLIDAAQSIQHIAIDVQALDCDFLAFSAHKIYGPNGIGVLYGKEAFLNEMPPYQGGGDMIDQVTFAKTTYNTLPLKFEAGTPNYIDSIAFETALDYVRKIGMDAIAAHEEEIMVYATEKLKALGGITIYGNAKHKAGAISFQIDGLHPYDTGMILDKCGVAVRTGTHCTQPIMDHFGIPGTVRASFAMYTSKEDIDALCAGLEKVRLMFG